MSGQAGFQVTDALPPTYTPVLFSKADIDELGLDLCVTVWRRMNGLPELPRRRRRRFLPRLVSLYREP